MLALAFQDPQELEKKDAAAPADAEKGKEDSKDSAAAKSDAAAAEQEKEAAGKESTAAEPAAPATAAAESPATTGRPATSILVEASLQFGNAINASTLRGEIETTADELDIPLSYFDVDNPEWDRIGSNAYTTWTVRLATSQEDAQRILDRLTQKFEDQPVWPSSNKIGPTVAGRLQRTAITALVASWLGIIVYVWIRFQNLVFGLAAVVALVHDVLVTIAALAVSHWLVGPLNFLLLEDFKISLTIVAALLTIIGYSINDTIVIFDRIREIRGKSPEITASMINLSLNQTLSRTILTFFTTFIVVVVLYVLGGQGIHGFAFAMVVGMLAGTYSTVFVATPFILWLAGKGIDAPRPAVSERPVSRTP